MLLFFLHLTMQQDYLTPTILVLYILYKEIFSKYINQKAKNIADIQDAPQLTQAIEEVKQDFRKEIESLKAVLAVSNSRQNRVDELRLTAMNEFVECCQHLIDLYMRDLGAITPGEFGIEYNNYQDDVEKAHLKIRSAYHVLIARHGDNEKDVAILSEKLSTLSNAIKVILKRHISGIIRSMKDELSIHNTNDSAAYRQQAKSTNDLMVAYTTDLKPTLNEFIQEFGKLLGAVNAYFKNIPSN